MNAEEKRLEESRKRKVHWKRWGPYLSERQWGTVREDYSPYCAAWEFFPHDHSRSRAYRWGEDGIMGISSGSVLKRLLSIFSDLGSSMWRFDSVAGSGKGNQLSSIEKMSDSQRITERSITFCNSRIFPGQGYD